MARIIPAFLIFLSLFCSGCSFVVGSMYGLKSPKKLNQTQIASQAKKYNIPTGNSFELDNAYMSGYLKSFDTLQYGAQVKNHYQPLQALYFDKTGKLQVFYINCYAGGFPNLDWNRDNSFSAFPPKPQAPVDSLVNLETLFRYLKPLPTANLTPKNSADYTIVVFWNRMMGRQSGRLIKYVQENADKAKDQQIQVLYVNTDNLMATF
jgi:hypothetical protein